MKKNINTFILYTLGILFLVFGIIGIFLPFLQGILFIIVGLVLLSLISPSFEAKLRKLILKNPFLHKHYSHHLSKLKKIHKNHTQ